MTVLNGLHYYYCPSFEAKPVEYTIVDGTSTLWSLMHKLYPYMKDRLPKQVNHWEYIGLGVYCNLQKETKVVSFTSTIGFDGVPAEVFELVEAEVFENGVRVDFDIQAFKARICGSTGYAGGISFNPTLFWVSVCL